MLILVYKRKSSTFEAGMAASASPHFGSIPSVAGKNLPNQSHIWSRLGWERLPKKLFSPGEWLTLMTDTFWFHICWNVESVTWPLWFGMIYWALTPVANVCNEGTGRPALQVDSVHQIAFSGRNKMDCLFTQKFFFFFVFFLKTYYFSLGYGRQMSDGFFA